MASLRYSHAIISRIPQTFKSNPVYSKENVDLEHAKVELEALCQTLRNIGIDVIELPPDDALPNSAFVEDIAFVCNGTALICRPRNPNRQKEVEIVRATIQKELKLPIVQIYDSDATLEGGDIFFTGKEFFVGISSFTNNAGAWALAAAFPEFSVTPVEVPANHHLKDFISMVGPNIICISKSSPAQSIYKRIAQEATYRYDAVTVPDTAAANCLHINNYLLHRMEFPDSSRVLEDMLEFQRFPIMFEELAKGGGHLSSVLILIKKSKYIKKL